MLNYVPYIHLISFGNKNVIVYIVTISSLARLLRR
nr:MAG TPA: hypothetical protein [Caudoviricetes sp.]